MMVRIVVDTWNSKLSESYAYESYPIVSDSRRHLRITSLILARTLKICALSINDQYAITFLIATIFDSIWYRKSSEVINRSMETDVSDVRTFQWVSVDYPQTFESPDPSLYMISYWRRRSSYHFQIDGSGKIDRGSLIKLFNRAMTRTSEFLITSDKEFVLRSIIKEKSWDWMTVKRRSSYYWRLLLL